MKTQGKKNKNPWAHTYIDKYINRINELINRKVEKALSYSRMQIT